VSATDVILEMVVLLLLGLATGVVFVAVVNSARAAARRYRGRRQSLPEEEDERGGVDYDAQHGE